MLALLLLADFALAQDDVRIGACDITFVVACLDCTADETFKAEIYTFAADGTRMQVAYKPHMKSGESVSSGNMTPGRRTLVLEDAEFATVACVNDEDVNQQVQVKLNASDTGDLEEDDSEYEPAPSLPESEEAYRPPALPTAPDPEPPPVPTLPVREEASTVSAPPPPLPEPPPAREEATEADTVVVPYNVGWGAPGGPPIWVGNPGDYPGRGPGRNGEFLDNNTTHCEAGKLPLVVGTADHIVGGHVNQVALDDARATAVAPPEWDGEYVGYTGTYILGDGAAAIYCVEPGTITRREPPPVLMADAAPPPPAPPGVTPADLEALEDKLREELKPQEPEPVEPPETVAQPTVPFVLRKGGFFAFQYSTTFDEGVNYPHAIVGGFVTFNLTKKEWLGLEPYLAFGTDFESDHCGNAEWGETECSGWFLSANVGARLPVTVIKKDTWRFMVHPVDLALVADDITTGFTAWGELISLQTGVELWLTGKVPLALSLEVGGTRLAFMNASFQHQNGWAFPIRADVKVPFK